MNTFVKEVTYISLGIVNIILSVSLGISVIVRFNTAFVYELVLHVKSNVTEVNVFGVKPVMFILQ